MDLQKFTQKSRDAIVAAQTLALENSHQALEQEHVLYALLDLENSLIAQLMKKMDIEPGNMQVELSEIMSRFPRVSGGGREADKIYITPDLDTALISAE